MSRRRRFSVDLPAVIVRTLVGTLLLLALVDPAFSRRDSRISTVYLLDLSGGITEEARIRALAVVAASRERNRDREDASLVVFAGESLAYPIDRLSDLVDLSMEPDRMTSLDREETRIDRAIRAATASLPTSGDRRIVLLTDGIETGGTALRAAADARVAGVRVSTVLIGGEGRAPGDAIVTGITVPSRLPAQSTFDVAVGITGGSGPGLLRLERDGLLIAEERLEPAGTTQVLRYGDRAPGDGVLHYRAEIITESDPVPQNNDAYAIARVEGTAAVLYVGREAGRPFARALATGAVGVREIAPEELSRDLSKLVRYRAIVLDDIEADSLSISHMETLERYVRETGGGVVFLGGPSSLAGGDYRGTAIEDLLPLSMDVAMPVQVPSLAMLFLIDKSGSMNSSSRREVSKLRLVQEAVLASLEVMQPNQLVGVMSFDSDWELTVPLTRAGDRTAIIEGIRSLSSGGGTVLETALTEAGLLLAGTESGVRHIVILSDGLVREADFRGLVHSLRGDEITVSTVTVGGDADRELMRMIAEEGAGRSYHSDGIDDIPRIFAEEANLVSRTIAVEDTVFPESSAGAAELGLALDPLPPVGGFVLTYPKATTIQLWDAAGGQPLLAVWRYGLGRSAAFTAAIDGGWGRDWIMWPQLPRFAIQLTRWVSRPEEEFFVRADRDTDGVLITVEDAAWISRAGVLGSLEASILGPDGAERSIPLRLTTPGRYEVRMEGQASGGVVRVSAADGGSAFDVLAPARSREYLYLEADRMFLEEIARLGDGRSWGREVEVVDAEALSSMLGATTRRGFFRTFALVVASLFLLGEVAYSLARRRARSYT